MNIFFKGNENDWQDLGGGIKRKIVGHTNDLMTVEVCFDIGSVGEIHHHEEHDQIGYVVSGSFEVRIEEHTKVLSKGDAFIVKKYTKHGVVSLEKNSVLLDIFSPIRLDLLKIT